jgi:hypothetical protein
MYDHKSDETVIIYVPTVGAQAFHYSDEQGATYHASPVRIGVLTAANAAQANDLTRLSTGGLEIIHFWSPTRCDLC